jgi:tetratricopeptide (TPR) repeat protein
MKRYVLCAVAGFIVAIPSLVGQSDAPGSADQLQQLTAQLQHSPGDQALREKIIALAQELKPAPELPDEAERRMARGIAAFKAAQSVADYQDAVKEFTQATLAAPWYGDAYFNLGLVQDKAEQYAAAVGSLKLALLASPGSKDIKDLMYQVEYRADQANTPDGKAEAKYGPAQHQFAALIQKLDGAVFIKDDQDANLSWHYGHTTLREAHFYRTGRYNLLVCALRIKEYQIEPDDKYEYEWKAASQEPFWYVSPQRATGSYGSGDLWFPDNGEVFFGGCILGRLSADGQTVDQIQNHNPGNGQFTLEKIGVWHRQ